MSFFYPSTTSERRSEDFALQVSRGQIPGHRSVTIFGFNGDVEATVIGSANNNSCSSMFVILLVAGPNAAAPGTPWI